MEHTHITKVLAGSMSLGRSRIVPGTLRVNDGPLPAAMVVDYTLGLVRWVDQDALGEPGPYVFRFEYSAQEVSARIEDTYSEAYKRTLTSKAKFLGANRNG